MGITKVVDDLNLKSLNLKPGDEVSVTFKKLEAPANEVALNYKKFKQQYGQALKNLAGR
jgi:predicted DNA-binding antitoxin AbrB/MazE fold protein